MALYVPEGRRRRRLLLAAAAALVVGLIVGAVAGRLSSQSVRDAVNGVRDRAHATSAGLRVISIHDQNGTGAGGAALVLTRTRSELKGEFQDAPWLASATRTQLLDQLDTLASQQDTSSKRFGDAAEKMAEAIDAAFAS